MRRCLRLLWLFGDWVKLLMLRGGSRSLSLRWRLLVGSNTLISYGWELITMQMMRNCWLVIIFAMGACTLRYMVTILFHVLCDKWILVRTYKTSCFIWFWFCSWSLFFYKFFIYFHCVIKKKNYVSIYELVKVCWFKWKMFWIILFYFIFYI